MTRNLSELSGRDQGRLIALLEGKLGAKAEAKLRARLDNEPALAEAWARLQATRSLLHDIAEDELPDVSFRQIDAQVRWRLAAEEEKQQAWETSRRPWRLAAAACAALVLGMVAGVVLDRSLRPQSTVRNTPAPAVVAAKPSKAPTPTPPPAPARSLAALAIVVNGEVNVAAAGGGALERLRLDRPLLPGDRILTSANGQVTLQWADGTGVLLGPDSELELRALTTRQQLLALHSGAGRFVVKPRRELPADERDRRVEVLTGNLRVRVVGTRFAVTLGPEQTAVEVSRGKVRAMPHDPRHPDRVGKSLLISAGQRLEVPRQGGQSRLVAADPARLKRPAPYLIAWRSLAHVLARTGRLQVDSRPIGAELHMDSVWVGQTNLQLRGMRGRHLLELWRDGKRLRRHWVQIGQGKPVRVALQLDTVRVRRVEKARLAPAIYRIIQRRAVLIRACYERRLKLRPHLAGKFELRFEIGRDGRVKKAHVDRDTLADPLVGRCAESAVKRWRFPPGNPATLVYPFVFKPR
jgi:ferric-dicitrate binding protein FerR (iron transport regulator)